MGFAIRIALVGATAFGCGKKDDGGSAPSDGGLLGSIVGAGGARSLSVAEQVAQAKASLSFAVIAGQNADADHVTGDLALTTTWDGVTVSWHSAHPGITAQGRDATVLE